MLVGLVQHASACRRACSPHDICRNIRGRQSIHVSSTSIPTALHTLRLPPTISLSLLPCPCSAGHHGLCETSGVAYKPIALSRCSTLTRCTTLVQTSRPFVCAGIARHHSTHSDQKTRSGNQHFQQLRTALRRIRFCRANLPTITHFAHERLRAGTHA
jgi:hypothetical protein